MSTTPPAASPPPGRRVRKRLLVPAVAAGLLLLLLGTAVVRGTWADKVPKDPAGPEEGVVCRLYRPADGPWQVRCAVVLEDPPERVWKVVTDYEHFADIFPTLESAEVERRP